MCADAAASTELSFCSAARCYVDPKLAAGVKRKPEVTLPPLADKPFKILKVAGILAELECCTKQDVRMFGNMIS